MGVSQLSIIAERLGSCWDVESCRSKHILCYRRWGLWVGGMCLGESRYVGLPSSGRALSIRDDCVRRGQKGK